MRSLQVSQRAFDSIVSAALVRPTHEACWQHSDNDALVLNVDDNTLSNLGKVCYGGLVRNFEVNFQFALYDSVDLSSILHTEIHTLTIRIKLC